MQAVRATAELTSAHAWACEARAFLVSGHHDAARAAFDELVGALQRRASRLAFHYLRDAGETDDAVQDAFVKAYVNLDSYRSHLPFEAWFTRILVNGCLDRLKRRRRQLRWTSPWWPFGDTDAAGASPERSPEDDLVVGEQRRTLTEAIGRLPDRQRSVVILAHLDGRTTREVGQIMGLSESTVRVHLFRAMKKLRSWLAPVGDGQLQDGQPQEMEA